MTAREVLNGRVGQTKYQPISCANKKKQSSSTLPDEIMFCILVWLPADILYQSARYVCRQWYNIIQDPHFIKKHLIRSVTGFLVQQDFSRHGVMFTKFGKRDPIVTEMSLPFLGMVLTTCNGLLLFQHMEARTVHVVNPLTKQMVALPQFSHPIGGFPFCSFGYAKSKGEYKVVRPYERCRGDRASNCEMLTLGKDHAWRLVHCDNLSDVGGTFWQFDSYPAGGFIFWAYGSCSHIVALDVESEIFYEFPVPAGESQADAVGLSARLSHVHYFRRGESLSCMVWYGPGLSFDVWVLSDPISGEWKKIFKINMNAIADGIIRLFSLPYGGLRPWKEFSFLHPIAWVENGDVVIFYSFFQGPYIAFNVKTGKTFKFGSCIKTEWRHMFGFSYSLVSWTPS
ncbi:hypothetical protein Vadar_002932 [Vaccinium darrowii]|uniref:Uncharacterized protein n=1 Tax=Vaccinium darrowii TaxID=229202 RepID=A0ACB7XFH9_9ERIC|nr:hypothetical protein Vadar_002932 [Vaccinium darrowii]